MESYAFEPTDVAKDQCTLVCQCVFYPSTEEERVFDIMYNPNTRSVLYVQKNVYVLPLPPTATFQDVFRVLGMADAHMEIVWSYHLKDTDTVLFLTSQVQHATMTHVRLFASHDIQIWWEEQLAITELIVGSHRQSLL